ncbi:hypothetical protein DAI22_07g091901 [Oryza sativa Japonica Group]|nr:hypothetical protein DAI22_07g091901 [Oryza sativa Japonica Group]
MKMQYRCYRDASLLRLSERSEEKILKDVVHSVQLLELKQFFSLDKDSDMEMFGSIKKLKKPD